MKPEERPENGKEDGHVHTGGRWFQAAGTASAKSQWAFASELKDSAAGWMRMGGEAKGRMDLSGPLKATTRTLTLSDMGRQWRVLSREMV